MLALSVYSFTKCTFAFSSLIFDNGYIKIANRSDGSDMLLMCHNFSNYRNEI